MTWPCSAWCRRAPFPSPGSRSSSSSSATGPAASTTTRVRRSPRSHLAFFLALTPSSAVMSLVKEHAGAYGVGVEYAYSMVHKVAPKHVHGQKADGAKH